MALASDTETIRVRKNQIVLIEDENGIGTGLQISDDGWVLTNKHVAPGLGPYRVILANGRDVRGVGVHQSAHHDLAIVKVGIPFSTYLDLGREVSDDYMVGTEVFALGHPRGCRFSVSRGIISNPHREFDKEYYVQTDVAINPGNSGGPLVDRDGKLIGIVTMILSASQGLGFAVPAYTAADYVRHVRHLLKHEVVRIPTDLLLAAAPERDAPEQVIRHAVEAVVQAGRASVESDDHKGRYELRRGVAGGPKSGVNVVVLAAEGALRVSGFVAALGPMERANATFLAKLLELNGTRELGGAAFSLAGDQLEVVATRSWNELSTPEAVLVIDGIIRLTMELPPRVAALAIGVSANAQPAAPAPAPMPAGDPGYPILTMPTSTDWTK